MPSAAAAIQEPTRLFALRHGRTAWNASQRIQGHTDIPLDEVGHAQAGRLAQALADEGLAAVYSSDLQRAVATAQALATASGLPVRTEPGLRERAFGLFEGVPFPEIERRWPADAERWRRRDPDFAPGGGETLLAFAGRCMPALAALAARHAGQAIAVVVHGGVLDCLYRVASGIPPEAPRTWQLGNASINRLLYNGSGFVIVGWNDDAHLAGLLGNAADAK